MNPDAEPGFALLNAAIPLTQGNCTIVATDHVAFLRKWRWRTSDDGYARRATHVAGKSTEIKMHRLIARLMGLQIDGDGDCAALEVDHRNGDRLDNRPANLRAATDADNARNAQRKRCDGTASSFKGVTRHKSRGRWRARIGTDGHINLGSYDTEVEAAAAYDAAARRLFGDFAAPGVKR